MLKDYQQTPDVDLSQTFSYVGKLSTVRSIISIAAIENINHIQFDESTALLFGKQDVSNLHKAIRMFYKLYKVCIQRICLYGLKHSTRCSNRRMLNHYLKEQIG